MKITGIEIGDYRQFKNIKFDFTYPEGHPKEGQPLEKVCFIGQSGTGKTTLLNLIWDFFRLLEDSYLAINNREVIHNNWAKFDIFYSPMSMQIENRGNKSSYKTEDLAKYDNHRQVRVSLLMKWLQENNLVESISTTDKACIFIKDSISREADAFLFNQKDQPQTFSDFVKTDTQIEKEKIAYEERISISGSKKVAWLGDMESLSIWQYLLKEINNYDEETVKQLTQIVNNTPTTKLAEKIQKWVATNPRFELAEKCLNPILDKLFLELDTEGGNVPIAIRTKKGIKIDSSYLSTGTRQLLSTAIPLYKFDTTDSVILFDEPERSLFPDIQRELIGHYTSLAPEAQFFFATHSPIIASAFEPCERFILSFNENGEVDCHNGIAPIGDDPNDILRKDFGMSPLVPNEGVEAYRRYLDLVSQIKKESDIERRMELIAERAKLGNDYNFPVATLDEKN